MTDKIKSEQNKIYGQWKPKPPAWKQILPNKKEAVALALLVPTLGTTAIFSLDALAKYSFNKRQAEVEALKQLHQQTKVEAPLTPKVENKNNNDDVPKIQEPTSTPKQAKQNTQAPKAKPKEATEEENTNLKEAIGITIDKNPLVIEPVKRNINLYNRIALKNKMLFCVPLHSNSNFIRSFVENSPKYKRGREATNRLAREQVDRLTQRPLFLAVIKKRGRLSAFILRAQDPDMTIRSDPDTYFSKDWLGEVKIQDDKSFTMGRSIGLNAQSEKLINAIFTDKGAQEYFELNK